MNDTSIKVTSLGIKFFLDYEKEIETKKTKLETLKSLLYRGKKKEFWALKNIDFETKKGEIFGIIGGNGAGKSTLLKVMAGIFPPTEGDVLAHGSMVPLIEIGAAFNPELTGAENIYFTGSIYRIPQTVSQNCRLFRTQKLHQHACEKLLLRYVYPARLLYRYLLSTGHCPHRRSLFCRGRSLPAEEF